jgi:hypothetical protein
MKLPGCVTEALWSITMNGFQDERTGEVDWGTCADLIFIDDGDNVVEVPGDGPNGDGAWDVTVPPGTYILCSDDQGNVWYLYYADRKEGRGRFEDTQSRYSEWLDQEERAFPEPIPF